MIPDRQLDPLAVLAAFGLSDCRLLKTMAGFSGATVWQVESGQSQFALKVYPPTWGGARQLMAIHQQIAVAGPDLMPQPMPSLFGMTVVETQNRLWDLTSWFSGFPIGKVDSVTVETIARLHVCWQLPTRLPQASDTVTRQWAILDAWECGQVTSARVGDFTEHMELLSRQIESTRNTLRPWLNRPVPAQTIHGDLWPGNVLMSAVGTSCIIDGASIRVDCIASDLARLFSIIDKNARQLIASAYEPTRQIQPVEWDLLDALSRTSPVVRLAQWLIWLGHERRTFANAPAAEQRFREVLEHCRLTIGVHNGKVV